MVAIEDGAVIGFAQMQSDGEIQAHLSLIAVDPAHRRRGLGRALIAAALERAGGQRVDLLTEQGQSFYEALPHRRLPGYRLWPKLEETT